MWVRTVPAGSGSDLDCSPRRSGSVFRSFSDSLSRSCLQDAKPAAVICSPPQAPSDDPENDKKVKNLKKVESRALLWGVLMLGGPG